MQARRRFRLSESFRKMTEQSFPLIYFMIRLQFLFHVLLFLTKQRIDRNHEAGNAFFQVLIRKMQHAVNAGIPEHSAINLKDGIS